MTTYYNKAWWSQKPLLVLFKAHFSNSYVTNESGRVFWGKRRKREREGKGIWNYLLHGMMAHQSSLIAREA